jgi:hypothetical protein
MFWHQTAAPILHPSGLDGPILRRKVARLSAPRRLPQHKCLSSAEAKFWVIVDRLEEQRTDTSLVRVVVWNTGRTDEATTSAALGLAQRTYPVLTGLFAR